MSGRAGQLAVPPAPPAARFRAAGKALLAVAALLVVGAAGLPLAPAAAATPPGLSAHSVTITIDDVRPGTPTPSATKRALQIVLTLRNTTAHTLPDISVTAVRGDPISTQSALDAAIAKPSPPSPDLVSPVHRAAQQVGALLPGASVDVPYNTSTSTNTQVQPGICLCHDAIYPLYFTAIYTDPDSGTSTTVGTAQTYFPAFGKTPAPQPLQVTWLWPLLDRPHRLTNQRVFLDDDLTGEVAPGGRLDRALQVVEDLAGTVPLTLVVDPDLLDELEVMASGNYRVAAPTTKAGSVPGTGAGVARLWLNRFTAVINAYPLIDVDLTAFADPDVESLARNGLTWTPAVGDQATQSRLANAFGARVPQRDVTWPVGNTVSQATLTTLVQQGTSTVVVDDRTLAGGRADLGLNALAPLQTSAGPALAAVTSKPVEDDVAAVLQPAGPGLAALPELIAHLALRVVADVGTGHYVVITPPRNLDVDPSVADRAILATAHTFWSRPLTLSQATQTVQASNHGQLHLNQAVRGLPPQAITAMQSVNRTMPGLTGKYGLLDRSSRSAATSSVVITVGKLPVGAQRSASCELISDPKQVIEQAGGLARIVDRLRAAVHVVPPAGNASYTLTSNEAPLPVTVANPLDVDAQVRIQVRAEDNRPGFQPETKDVKVPAGSTEQVRVPTSIDIAGRINVIVTLSTPNGMSVGGAPLQLSVRNTALGTVGVAITTIAAVILAIALLFRAGRAIRWRMRRRGSQGPGPQPPVTDPLAP